MSTAEDSEKRYTELFNEADELEAAAESYAANSDDDASEPDENTEQQMYREALSKFRQLSIAMPEKPEPKFRVSRILLTLAGFIDEDQEDENEPSEKLELIQDAVSSLRKALEVSPKNPVYEYHLAQALIATADIVLERPPEADDADPYAEESTGGQNDREDEHADAYNRPGSVVVKVKAALSEACSLLEHVLVEQKKDFESGNTENNVTVDTLVDTLVSHAEALNSYAMVSKEKEGLALFDDAVEKLKHAIEICEERKSELLQEWAATLEARAEWYSRISSSKDQVAKKADYSAALEKLNEAVAADDQNADAYCDRADLLVTIGQSEFLHAMMLAEEKDDGEEEIKIDAQVAICVLKCYDDAIASMESAVKIAPDSAGMHQQLGDICFSRARLNLSEATEDVMNFLNKAEAAFREALQIDEEDFMLAIRLSQVLFVKNQEDDVKEMNALMERFRELGGDLSDLLEEPEVFEEEFVAAVSALFPDFGWEDDGDDDDDDEYEN